MTVLRRIAGVAVVLCGVAAAAIIVVGVPIALARGFGWPLPHAIPSWSEISAALQGGIPDMVWIDTLACVCWAAWLYLVTTLSLEAVATARGVAATRLALTKPGQRLAASLIATVVFGVALLSTRPTPSRGTAPLAAAIHAARLADSIVTPLPAPSAAGSSGPAPAASTITEQVAVRSGDTLWGIAGRELHNSTRWPAIWQANEHRVEADGRRFDNPHWIYPGWRLDVPGVPATSPPAPAPSVTTPPSSPARTTLTPTPPLLTPAIGPSPASTVPAPTATAAIGSGLRPSVAPTGHSGGGEASQSTHADWTVTLARDGLIGGGLAAGLAVLLLGAQRYERWRRRPSDQARSRVALLARRPNMLRIRGALAAAVGSDHADPDQDAPALGGADLQAVLAAVQSVPGRILVGQRRAGGAEVVADIDQLHGLVLSGSGGVAVGRALLLSFLVHHPWEMAQAVIGGATGSHLLPGAESVPGLQLHPEIDAFLTQLEGEVGYQRSILDREHLDDWRELGSDDPLPALMALVRAEDLSPAHLDRLGAVVSDAEGCAIAVIVLGSFADLGWGRHLAVDADGRVDPANADPVIGASVLYHLDEEEAEELLAVVAAGRGPDIVPEISEEEEATVVLATERHDVPHQHEPTSAPAIAPSVEVRPVDVRIFGRVRVLVNGREVETGIPASGRQVLALLVVRGELTEAQGVDAFSAGNSSDYYANQWAAGTRKTRAALRDLLGDRTVNCLTCVGGLFRLNDEMVSSDYGRLLAGRRAARETADAEARRALLATATRDLRGEPFANAAYNWLIEDEAAVRSRAMTALEELARLHADAGDLDAAVMALDQALSLDPDPVEAVFQQMMLFQHRLGHGEAVRDLYGRLRHQLVLRCDREPSAETESLMESLGSAARLVAG